MNLLSLPEELIGKISYFLSVKDMCNLRLTGTVFKETVLNEMKKTREYWLYLHNIYLSEHLLGVIDKEDKSIIKFYNWKKVEENYNGGNTRFLINYFGSIMPWIFSRGAMKRVNCTCERDICKEENYFVDIYASTEDLLDIYSENKSIHGLFNGPLGIKEGFIRSMEKLKR